MWGSDVRERLESLSLSCCEQPLFAVDVEISPPVAVGCKERCIPRAGTCLPHRVRSPERLVSHQPANTDAHAHVRAWVYLCTHTRRHILSMESAAAVSLRDSGAVKDSEDASHFYAFLGIGGEGRNFYREALKF